MVDLPEWVRPGAIVDAKYEVVRVLGAGGMGVVCEARHRTLGERVAIKVMLAATARSPEATARFLREARAAFAVRNEHVARVLDAGTGPTGDPYLVMELLDGQDLSRVVQERGPLSLADAVEYIVQACAALSAAHAMGIVHRDVKPANLFLTRRPGGAPLLKVLDFGIAKADEPTGAGLTETSVGMGTLPYMSPEQVKAARDVDARADVYSLGATLHELLTARRLIDAPSGAELIVQILHGESVPLRAYRPDAPAALEAVILRATRKSRDERFPSAHALAEAARASLAGGAAAGLGAAFVPSYGPVGPSALASTALPGQNAFASAPVSPYAGGPSYGPTAYPSHPSPGGYRGVPAGGMVPYGLAPPRRGGAAALIVPGAVITTGGVLTFVATAANFVNGSEIGTAIAIGVAACAVGGPLLAAGILRASRG